MKALRMLLSELKRPERNIRIHTEAQLKEFERSVKMFGQLRPIVIDETNTILAGNGLYDTLQRLGQKDAEVYQYDDLTENQKKKLMIADNKVYGLGVDDYDVLDAFLLELKDDLDIPGFDEDILKSMTSSPDDITDALSDYGKLSSDEAADVAAAAERKRQAVDTAAAEPERNEPFKQPETPPESKTVVCPNCGVTICL
jgi:ParB-like chromosome segregation protein Spo0J